jgi:hypothetical protein
MTQGTEGVGTDAGDVESFKQFGLKKQFRGLAAKTQLDFWDAIIRRNIAYSIMGLFAVVNLATLAFVYGLLRVDQADLVGKLIGPGDRVVNASVVMTLLGATTVQLGTAMLIMARFVFRPVDRGGLRAE